MNTFWDWVGQVVVVGVGWYVVHRLSEKRDREKSCREMIAKAADGMVNDLNNIITDAHRYHLNERDNMIELKIKISLQDAIIQVASLRDVNSDSISIDECTAAIGALRRKITGQHFDDEHDGPLESSDSRLQEMAAAVLKAKQEMLNLKYSQFRVALGSRYPRAFRRFM